MIRGITPDVDKKIKGKVRNLTQFLGLAWALLCFVVAILVFVSIFLPKSPIVIITSPADGTEVDDRIIIVNGTISQYNGDTATLTVNRRRQVIEVKNGAFSEKAVLTSGKNLIQVSASNKGRLGKDEVTVFSKVKATKLWVQLTWGEDESDVDLYVTEPDGSTAWWSKMENPSGGFLDVDDTDGYGPEHYYISIEEGHRVDPGGYTVRVHYYAPHEHQGPIHAEIIVLKNETYYNMYKGTIFKANDGGAGPGGWDKDAESWKYIDTVWLP